jgi:hypothetical protein
LDDRLSQGVTQKTIPKTVVWLGEFAFYRTMITEIDLPDGITSIPHDCFDECHLLSLVRLPRGLTGIDASAFA